MTGPFVIILNTEVQSPYNAMCGVQNRHNIICEFCYTENKLQQNTILMSTKLGDNHIQRCQMGR